MKKALFLYLAFICSCSISRGQQCPIIPLPGQSVSKEGVFIMSKDTPIIPEDPSLTSLAHFLQQEMLKNSGMTLSIQSKTRVPAIILKRVKGKENHTGSYHLLITPGAITISSGTNEGLFYGLNSLLQLIRQAPLQQNSVALSCWEITDHPAYSWRGIMLDESRHFFGMETVKFILDWMAFYKLNRFHWHLTDKPGWRLEIKRYPKLALIGGIGNHSDPFVPAAYYTQEEIKEIVSYAQARYISVIPEIDMPGHATAANRAYPEFSGGGSAKRPDFTFNPGMDSTYAYLSDILQETDALFPSEMIHLGGDEVRLGDDDWNRDPDVQRLMNENDLPDLKAVEKYFVQRMADSVKVRNNKVLLWDEAAEGSLSPENSIIFWWRHDKPEQLKLALSKGFTTVLTPRLPLYFDFVQDSFQRIGRRWGGQFNSLEKVYDFHPERFPEDGQEDLILGVQGSLWTERIRTEKKLEYMLFPRIAALAEMAWTDNSKKDYSRFIERLKGHLALFRSNGIYFYNPFNPEENPEPIMSGENEN